MTSSKNTKLQSQQRWTQFLLKGSPKIQTMRYFCWKNNNYAWQENDQMDEKVRRWSANVFSFPKQVPKKVHFEDAQAHKPF